MKHTLFLLLLIGIVLPIQSQDYQKISKAKVSFVFVDKDVDGTISGFTSSSKIDVNEIESSSFSGSVSVETIKTGNVLRDWSIKGGKYFDAKNHPYIKFSSTKVVQEGNTIQVTGDLTIKGTTKVEVFEFTRNEKQWIGTCSLNSYDYGIAIKKKRVDNTVAVKIELFL